METILFFHTARLDRNVGARHSARRMPVSIVTGLEAMRHQSAMVARNYTTPTECDHGYTTPLVIQHNGKESVLVWGAEQVTIHDAGDGAVVWSCGNFNPAANKLWPAIATPVIVDDMAVVCFGRNGSQ